MKKYIVHGPVQDGMFTCWQVIGPRGAVIAVFNQRTEAMWYIKQKGSKKS